jgi:hypothetical protein
VKCPGYTDALRPADTDDLILAKLAIWAGEADTSALIRLDLSSKYLHLGK